MDIDQFREQYSACEHDARRFQKSIIEQIEHLLSKNTISLGVPLESRIKSWNSIGEKIQRKSLDIQNIHELDDLVGIRLILLFKNDTETVCSLLSETFKVISKEDTGERLGETQFGYQSTHYVIGLPEKWLGIPTLIGLEKFKCEVQVRSLAQHIWAAASHKLQYKREASVPPPLRRTINRISALLETVDLEFDRVLGERKIYVTDAITELTAGEPLNVDIIEKILDELLPPANKHEEDFDSLLKDLTKFNVTSAEDLRKLLIEHKDKIIQAEAKEVADRQKNKRYVGTSEERTKKGVFYTFTGLTRGALKSKFGEKIVNDYLVEKIKPPKKQ